MENFENYNNSNEIELKKKSNKRHTMQDTTRSTKMHAESIQLHAIKSTLLLFWCTRAYLFSLDQRF